MRSHSTEDDCTGRAAGQASGRTVPGAHAGVHGLVREARFEVPMSISVSSPLPTGTTTLVRPDELAFTVVSASDKRPLAKRFWLGGTNDIETETAAALTRGDAKIEYAP